MRPVRLGCGSKKSSAYFLMTFSPAEAGLLVFEAASVGGLVVFREFRDDDRTGPDHDLRPEVKGPLSLI
jgi:hypothetical protein